MKAFSRNLHNFTQISTVQVAIVWYGGINALAYTSEEDNMIKVTDNNLASELTNTLLSINSA